MSDDEGMTLNITVADSNKDSNLPTKRKREETNKEPPSKKIKTTHGVGRSGTDRPKPKNVTSKPGLPRPKVRGQLTKDLSITKQTKQEIAEKTEEIFEGSDQGFDRINARMKENLEKHLNITRPTKVQLKSLPHILAREDVLMKSKTGSGKTLAYLLPSLHLLQEKRTTRADGTYMIVIAPTRELALQISEVATVLLRQFPWIVFGTLMGGESKKREKSRIRKGLSVIVATPGRLLDHLQNTASFNVSRLEWMILDEADRLLDLGFEFALKKIISILDEKKLESVKRQNLLISATLEGRIKKLASITLQSPVYVNLAGDNDIQHKQGIHAPVHSFLDDNDDDDANDITEDEEKQSEEEENFQVPKHLLQSFTIVETKQKLVALITFLRLQSFSAPDTCKVLVFVLTTDIVEFLYSLFEHAKFESKDEDGELFVEDMFGVPLFKLHGNMSQGQRTAMFKKYRSSKNGILFCTDVAARGLDVPDIKWIVQYDAPTETKEYVHRIGRTARFTGQGRSIIFLSSSEKDYISHLAEHQLEVKEIYVDTLLNTLQIPATEGKQRLPPQLRLQNFLEDKVAKNKKLFDIACSAFRSYTRGYATYPKGLKFIFHVKSLHLGHIAKMFALSEAPSKFSNVKTVPKHKGPKHVGEEEKPTVKEKKNVRPPTAAQRMLSEFSAG